MTITAVREMVLRPDTTAPSRARTFVTELLETLGYEDKIDISDAKLIACELVTNALRATRVTGSPKAMITICLDETVGKPVIEVWDCSIRRPVTRAQDLDAENGRGLTIVRALAESVGWDFVPGGKVVWAYLKLKKLI